MEINLMSAVASVALICVTGLVALLLLDFYSDSQPQSTSRLWFSRWEVQLETEGFSKYTLILASMLGLFLELMLIRWVSSEIRIFAYFKNFVLMACFLGFGLGCSLCHRKINLLPSFVSLLVLTLIIKLPWEPLRNLIDSLPLLLASFSDINIWGVPGKSLTSESLLQLLGAVIIISPLFVLLALVLLPLGQIVGWQFECSEDGIGAYTVNVLASLAGILLYTLLCYFWQPPAFWMLVAGGVSALLFARHRFVQASCLVVFAICATLASWHHKVGETEYWSPYQKLTLSPEPREGKPIRYNLFTNDYWYQWIIDLSHEFVATHQDLFQGVPISLNAYNLPYRFYPMPPSVLVLGAGTGNDVAAALRNNAGKVVAVEIDPLILRLGKDFHFERPYDSPRVRTVLNDARSYVENSDEQFDLIVFSLLDSHTTTSHYTNIRIDNYVYTLEALQAARHMLKPDGVFIVKFQVETPWIAGRLEALLTEVFGEHPLQLQAEESYTTAGRFFLAPVAGSRVRAALADAGFADYVKRHGSFRIATAVPTTDDWPYFYQRRPGLPVTVIVISLTLLTLCWGLMRRVGAGVQTVQWRLFFLGAGFMLLEVQIISRAALLFGTTWIVNSLVISAILLVIVGANIVAKLNPHFSKQVAYAGLFLSMTLAYALPLRWLFLESQSVKIIASMILLCAPVFFAGIVFVRAFAEAGFKGEALGSNLLGAAAGGFLESLSYWTGLKALLIVAAILYSAALLSGNRGVRTANGSANGEPRKMCLDESFVAPSNSH
jgi:SAM-dependent methyltransferase